MASALGYTLPEAWGGCQERLFKKGTYIQAEPPGREGWPCCQQRDELSDNPGERLNPLGSPEQHRQGLRGREAGVGGVGNMQGLWGREGEARTERVMTFFREA